MTVNTKPIGVAYEDQNIIGADKVLASDEFGYTTDAQGTVTQATSKSTAVSLNKSAGRITMNAASLAGVTNVSFTFNNDNLSVNDILVVQLSTGNTANSYQVWVDSLAAGSAVIVLRNTTAATALAEAVVLNFAVIHCL
jgi:microcompartment protein CcmK/EutM